MTLWMWLLDGNDCEIIIFDWWCSSINKTLTIMQVRLAVWLQGNNESTHYLGCLDVGKVAKARDIFIATWGIWPQWQGQQLWAGNVCLSLDCLFGKLHSNHLKKLGFLIQWKTRLKPKQTQYDPCSWGYNL